MNLTPHQLRIAVALAKGKPQKQIASDFNITLNTLHIHIGRIYKRLGIHTSTSLVHWAIKKGYVQAGDCSN